MLIIKKHIFEIKVIGEHFSTFCSPIIRIDEHF